MVAATNSAAGGGRGNDADSREIICSRDGPAVTINHVQQQTKNHAKIGNKHNVYTCSWLLQCQQIGQYFTASSTGCSCLDQMVNHKLWQLGISCRCCNDCRLQFAVAVVRFQIIIRRFLHFGAIWILSGTEKYRTILSIMLPICKLQYL